MITQNIPRRGFLGAFAAALMLDPERLLWVSGKKLITLPKRAVSYVGVGSSYRVGDVVHCDWAGDDTTIEEVLALSEPVRGHWKHLLHRVAIMSPSKRPSTTSGVTQISKQEHDIRYGQNPLPNKFRSMLGRQDG